MHMWRRSMDIKVDVLTGGSASSTTSTWKGVEGQF